MSEKDSRGRGRVENGLAWPPWSQSDVGSALRAVVVEGGMRDGDQNGGTAGDAADGAEAARDQRWILPHLLLERRIDVSRAIQQRPNVARPGWYAANRVLGTEIRKGRVKGYASWTK